MSNDLWYTNPKFVNWSAAADSSGDLVGVKLSTRVCKVRSNSHVSDLINDDSIRLTHIKVGGNQIEAFEGPRQVPDIKPHEAPFVFLLYEKSSDSPSNGLQKDDKITGDYMFRNPEWSLGQTHREAKRYKMGSGAFAPGFTRPEDDSQYNHSTNNPAPAKKSKLAKKPDVSVTAESDSSADECEFIGIIPSSHSPNNSAPAKKSKPANKQNVSGTVENDSSDECEFDWDTSM